MFDRSENNNEGSLLDEFKSNQATLLAITFKPQQWSLALFRSDTKLDKNEEGLVWLPRPHLFGIIGVPFLDLEENWYSRYLTFNLGTRPMVIVEFLFPGEEYNLLAIPRHQRVEETPRTEGVFELTLRARNYVVFNPTTCQMYGFRLVGDRYKPTELTSGRFLVESIKLSLSPWYGNFRGMERVWLRWMTLDGQLIWTPEEER